MKIHNNFSSSPSTWLHIDLNSCFASIEQQANPLLRGKPIAVAAYTTARGCILAPSIEAKRYGVKTGMRVMEGKALCPQLIILPSDPPKYRFINRILLKLLNEYSPYVFVRSIDEMLLNFAYLTNQKMWMPQARDGVSGLAVSRQNETQVTQKKPAGVKWMKFAPSFSKKELSDCEQHTTQSQVPVNVHESQYIKCSTERLVRRSFNESEIGSQSLTDIACEIKSRIKQEIGDWLTVSVGISSNPYLAKLAAGLHKPDGLDEINKYNILNILSSIKLTDLPYIKERNALRLNLVGVKTPLDFYFASPQQLKAAFQSIQGYYWYLRLHGYEVDAVEWQRRSVGHSYALPKFTNDCKQLHRILCKLVEKMGARLRKNHWTAKGVYVACEYEDWSFWHKSHKFPQAMYASSDLLACAEKLLESAPLTKRVRTLAVSCLSLTKDLYRQLTLFKDELKKRALTQAIDDINEKWGEFSIIPATMMDMKTAILDRISFGSVHDMPQNYIHEQTDISREACDQ